MTMANEVPDGRIANQPAPVWVPAVVLRAGQSPPPACTTTAGAGGPDEFGVG